MQPCNKEGSSKVVACVCECGAGVHLIHALLLVGGGSGRLDIIRVVRAAAFSVSLLLVVVVLLLALMIQGVYERLGAFVYSLVLCLRWLLLSAHASLIRPTGSLLADTALPSWEEACKVCRAGAGRTPAVSGT